MKTHPLISSGILLFLLVSSSGAATPNSAPAVKPVATHDSPETALTQGMPADAVRKIMGKPAKITPMKAPNGKAEIWNYERQTGERVDRVEIGSVPITTVSVGSDGKAHQQTIGETMQFGDLNVVTEEIVEVLMFNDHYVTHKISTRELKHYN